MYETNLERQSCTCMAGQYGHWCKHLTALAQEARDAAEKIAAASARWAAAEAAVQRARFAHLTTRGHWAAYPGID